MKGIQTAHTNEPWLFVIKKNSSSLKQVYEWLRDNASPDDQLPLTESTSAIGGMTSQRGLTGRSGTY